MRQLAYNPATGKFRGKLDTISALVETEAGFASLEKQNVENDIYQHERYMEESKERIADHERQVRGHEEDITELKTKLAAIAEVDPAKIKKTLQKKIKTMDVFQRGLIKNITREPRANNIVYITTANLAFYKGTPLQDYNVTRKIDLGHYLIKLDISRNDVGMLRGICNLDYQCDNANPTMTNTSICLGSSESELRTLTRRRDIMGVIDFTINYIMSPHDYSGYTTWGQIFRERRPLKGIEIPGRPIGIFQDGCAILPIPQPLTLVNYKEILKTVPYRYMLEISRNGKFQYLKNFGEEMPDMYICRENAEYYVNIAGQCGVSDMLDKIETEYISKVAREMMRRDIALGYAPAKIKKTK